MPSSVVVVLQLLTCATMNLVTSPKGVARYGDPLGGYCKKSFARQIFVHASFIKILPRQTFTLYGIIINQQNLLCN